MVSCSAMSFGALCCLAALFTACHANLPSVDASQQINVGILIMNGVFISEATIPFDVYKHVGADHMNVFFVAESMTPVYTYYGARLKPHYTFSNSPAVDILVVPSGAGSHHSFLTSWYKGAKGSDGIITGQNSKGQPVTYHGNQTALIDWVRAQSAAAKIVTSHCWGAFTLADAGVLDGKAVTTFPGYTQTLDDNYPAIGAVIADLRFVVSGKVVTSNGGLAAFEACLYVVRHLYGDAKADSIVSGLVYSHDNVGHSKASYYKVSPPKMGTAPALPAGTINVGIWLMDGVFISEPSAPFDVFAHMGGAMNVFFVGETMDPKTTYYGATMHPDYTFSDAPRVDILVVPSGIGSHWSFLQQWYGGTKGDNGIITGSTTTGVSVAYYGNSSVTLTWLKSAAATAQYVTSHCWGAFTLADAGLLDGKTATTFPGYTDELDAYYPAIAAVVADNRIVHDGKVITSSGGVGAYEAANYLVKLLYGDYYAKQVATALVFAADNYEAVGGAHVVLPKVDVSQKINVGILIMNGVFISEATIPFDVYKHVGADHMNVFFVAESMTPVYTYYGARLKPHYTFSNSPTVDILVVPSGAGSHHSFLTSWYKGAKGSDGIITGQNSKGQPVTYYGNQTALIDWVRAQSAAAKIVTSHCWGAFTLADAGVLDGKAVTTFPGYTQTLDDNYPAIGAVIADQRFVVSGKVVTSNGGLAAFEACLYVVRHLYGDAKADSIVSGLVYSHDNVGHSKASYYKVSPPKTGTAPALPAGTINVGIWLMDGVFISEPSAPFDVFAHMGGAMNVFFVGETMDPKTTYYGATMHPDYTFSDAPRVDILVVPSGIGSHWSFLQQWYGGTKDDNGIITGSTTTGVSVAYYGNSSVTLTWLKSAAATAQYVTSHCWGAFTLADAGLLDGKTATTFPGYTDELDAYYPAIAAVVADNRIVHDGKVITSSGGVGAYEAANYLVKLLYGDYYAKQVATALVFAADNYEAMSNAAVIGVTAQSLETATATRTSVSIALAFVLLALRASMH